MDKLKLMKIAEEQDSECIEDYELDEQINIDKDTLYKDYYDDVKRSCDYIKEDW